MSSPTIPQETHTLCVYVCLISFLWYHGVERNISKCMGWNQLWRYLGEYWNKLNFTCLICSWSLSWSLVAISSHFNRLKLGEFTASLSWSLVAISSHFNRLKWLEIATRDQERLQLQMRQVKFNLFQYSPRYRQSWFQPIHLLIFRSTPWYHRKLIKHTYTHRVWVSCDDTNKILPKKFLERRKWNYELSCPSRVWFRLK